MCLKLIRTFHPVGQGAFYSETFEIRGQKFNMVYDCGSLSRKSVVDATVKNSFDKNEEIDILFISHFDADHVNKIKILKESVKNIKRVVLPLLNDEENDEEKKFLLGMYKNLNEDENVLQLIEDPQGFFGNGTKIIAVDALESGDEQNSAGEPVDIDELGKENEIEIIKSGTKIGVGKSVFGQIFWIYIPYNYQFKARHKQLLEILKQHGICKQDLMDPNFIVKDRSELRKVYTNKELTGNINQNSMLVYSNSINNVHCREVFYCHRRRECCCVDRHMSRYWRRGCIYTGDADLTEIKEGFFNKLKCHSETKHYFYTLGVVQVAHHGSYKSFNIDFYNEIGANLICPISVGTRNCYGHPGGIVLRDLMFENHIPILVTEREDSVFIQKFIINF